MPFVIILHRHFTQILYRYNTCTAVGIKCFFDVHFYYDFQCKNYIVFKAAIPTSILSYITYYDFRFSRLTTNNVIDFVQTTFDTITIFILYFIPDVKSQFIFIRTLIYTLRDHSRLFSHFMNYLSSPRQFTRELKF